MSSFSMQRVISQGGHEWKLPNYMHCADTLQYSNYFQIGEVKFYMCLHCWQETKAKKQQDVGICVYTVRIVVLLLLRVTIFV